MKFIMVILSDIQQPTTPTRLLINHHGCCEAIQIILSITINRKTIKGKYTDMSWYLENIIYKFLSSDVRLLSYKIEEYED